LLAAWPRQRDEGRFGALGTAAGIGAGRALLSWIVNTNMSETMPDVGMLTTLARPRTRLPSLPARSSSPLHPC
jgi:hypothetical protein